MENKKLQTQEVGETPGLFERIYKRKRLLAERGLKLSDFGVDKSVTSRVINERLVNRNMRRRIARKLKVPYSEVWPKVAA